jgi:D-amino-acid oxidase
MERKKVVILGSGVNGLSTAIRIRQIPEQPYDVVIISENFPPETTSDISGGIWIPFECEPKLKVNEWASTTYPILMKLAEVNPYVCGVRDANVLYTKKPSDNEISWRDYVVGFRELREEELRGAPHGYYFRAPNLNTSRYLKWLMQWADKLGVQFYRYKINSLDQLFKDWKGDIFINCLAIGARDLFNDQDVFPIRGVLVHLKAQPSFNKFICWDDSPEGLTYIIPRADKVILGGTHDHGDWNRTPTQQELDSIYKRCIKLAPELEKSAQIIGNIVGLRPGRKSLRIEIDLNHQQPIIHNYGHGGSGLTVHWGTAAEVVSLLLKNFPIISTKHKL